MTPNSSVEERPGEMEGGETEVPMAPRGTRRILYVSDPSSIAANVLPDRLEADDLRRWVGLLADSGVDIFQQDVYNQGFTVYWRSTRLQYDPRPQHQKFLPMLDAGLQPLQVLLEHSRQRGLAFVAGFRMNDNHSGEHFPFRADFIESHPEWRLRDPGHGPDDFAERMLDFTFAEVRQFVFEVMEEVVSRFDVDGLEMTFREPAYFPLPHGRERAPLMTDLVRRVRGLLDDRSQSQGRRILLGARVFSTLEQCLDLGLDVPAWIAEGLIDQVSPMDPMFSDFNAPYADFAALTRQSQCMLYPGMAPWTSQRARTRAHLPLERRVRGSANMTRSNERALAHTFYGAGADGISIYNHFVGHLYPPPLYPQALQVFHELRDPQRVARGDRHYIFEPTYDELGGPPNAQWVGLDRGAPKPSGEFRFRLYEQRDQVHGATLLLRGNLTERDEVEVRLNGLLLASGPLGQPDPKFLRPFPDVRWFPVLPAALAWGGNRLSITLTHGDPQASGEIVIDEVEVWVQPE